ncbi:Glycine-rich protein GRP33 [Eumeta japonica]|uniref:Glycine-rich protein GRP33 n=1 Tax=Eumeta variegata TaxID=151549 RepID=A0A4C1XPZ3_EUMVA|nr:Glycine-rich protein GRP33 [Eumeta japonica]
MKSLSVLTFRHQLARARAKIFLYVTCPEAPSVRKRITRNRGVRGVCAPPRRGRSGLRRMISRKPLKCVHVAAAGCLRWDRASQATQLCIAYVARHLSDESPCRTLKNKDSMNTLIGTNDTRSSKNRRPPSPMDACNLRGVTSALPASWLRIGYPMAREWGIYLSCSHASEQHRAGRRTSTSPCGASGHAFRAEKINFKLSLGLLAKPGLCWLRWGLRTGCPKPGLSRPDRDVWATSAFILLTDVALPFAQEEELRVSGDPKFAHLSDELHVEISAFATPAEAHARIAYALAELRRFLVPAPDLVPSPKYIRLFVKRKRTFVIKFILYERLHPEDWVNKVKLNSYTRNLSSVRSYISERGQLWRINDTLCEYARDVVCLRPTVTVAMRVSDYNDDIRQEQMLEMQILSSQNEQRRLTPPGPSRAPSDDGLPLRENPAHAQHRLSGVPAGQPAPLASALTGAAQREYSPPAPAPAPDHLAAHHQLTSQSGGGHGVLMGGVLQPPAHHLLAHNSILVSVSLINLISLVTVICRVMRATEAAVSLGAGGGELLGLGGSVLGGGLLHPALRGVKPAVTLATQGATGAPAPTPAAAAAAPRKRPLLGGARAAMSPTKRAVMSLLARARAATHKHAPAWPAPHQ